MSDILREFDSQSFTGYANMPTPTQMTAYSDIDSPYEPQTPFRQARQPRHRIGESQSGAGIYDYKEMGPTSKPRYGVGKKSKKGGSLTIGDIKRFVRNGHGRQNGEGIADSLMGLLGKAHDYAKENKLVSGVMKNSKYLNKYANLAEKMGYGREHAHHFHELHQQHGGGWSDFTNWVKKAATKVYDTAKNVGTKIYDTGKKVHDFVKDNKLVSKVAGMVPLPQAQALAARAANAGYGRQHGSGYGDYDYDIDDYIQEGGFLDAEYEGDNRSKWTRLGHKILNTGLKVTKPFRDKMAENGGFFGALKKSVGLGKRGKGTKRGGARKSVYPHSYPVYSNTVTANTGPPMVPMSNYNPRIMADATTQAPKIYTQASTGFYAPPYGGMPGPVNNAVKFGSGRVYYQTGGHIVSYDGMTNMPNVYTTTYQWGVPSNANSVEFGRGGDPNPVVSTPAYAGVLKF